MPRGSLPRYPFTENMTAELRRIYQASNECELREGLDAFLRRHPMPRHIATLKAQRLRIAGMRPSARKPWLPAELEWVLEHAGEMSVRKMAARLGCSMQRVRNALAWRGRQWRVVEGYSQAEIAQLLGVNHQTVARWVTRGWLESSEGIEGRIPHSEIERFVRLHPEEFRLARVDEAWFKGLLFPAFGRGMDAKKLPAAEDPEEREFSYSDPLGERRREATA